MPLKKTKYRQTLPKFYIATLTHQNQSKHVHYLDELKTVLPSQKDLCHPVVVDFGNHQFTIRINDKAEKIINKPPEKFSL